MYKLFRLKYRLMKRFADGATMSLNTSPTTVQSTSFACLGVLISDALRPRAFHNFVLEPNGFVEWRECDLTASISCSTTACQRPQPQHFAVDLVLRPVHLLRVSLLRVLESNSQGDSLYNSTDMIIPTP